MPQKVYETRSSNTKAKVKYTTWTTAMDNCLSKILAEHAKEGSKGENIKPATYDAAVRAVNENFGLELNKHHVKNRLKTLKKQYAVLSEIVGRKGFKWDKAQKMVIANDATWKEYIKVNPDAKTLRDKAFENYDELGIIVGTDQALASCSDNDTHGVDEMFDNFETAIEPEIQSDEKQTKNLRWTEQMDNCLGKILTEQVQKGYKIGNTLHTEAYEAAVRALNKECGPGFSKENIKNRLKTWRKQYSILNELLSNDGFKWDAMQKMIVGNDSLWDEYIKTNPEAKYLRGRCIENYDALHFILGNDSANRCWSTTGEKGDGNLAPCNQQHNGIRLPDVVEELSLDNTCEGTQGSSQQTRARPSSSSRSKQLTKKRSSSDAMVEVMRAVAVNIGRIADALTANESVCLDEIFEMVKNIPGFDDDLIIDACEFLSFDEKRAKMFLKLDERLRKMWLLKRLRSQGS
ncbi:unnamed protein product [Coffea canephora]|uniref:Myb/SANT-like domain-containing protein n=1 Tax=Coffea canephora TaxID=49390 RepID=A0A068UPX5_COFCA|nr:unnamed protein product [Coffea canephora]